MKNQLTIACHSNVIASLFSVFVHSLVDYKVMGTMCVIITYCGTESLFKEGI